MNATNCSFVGNTAQTKTPNDFMAAEPRGGAVRNEAGQVHLQACTFLDNRASGGAGAFGASKSGAGDPGFGGAIHNSGTVTLNQCTFAGNSATGGAGCDQTAVSAGGCPGAEGSGGAIFNEGTLIADQTTFWGNTTTGGSGGKSLTSQGYPTFDGYPGRAGGNANGAAICNVGSLWVTRSTFASNVASGGAGSSGAGGQPIVDMGANGGPGGDGGSGLGGALFNSGTASLVNCTIALNTGSGGNGGGGGAGASNKYGGWGGPGGNGGSALGGVHGTCSLTNCTIAWNLGSGGTGGAGGPGGAGGYGGYPGGPGSDGATGAAWGGTACSTLPNTLIASNTPAGDDSFPDPKLGPLTNNGGPTLTMALLPGSLAIDAGNTSLAPTCDQRGYPRPAGLAADIGAFEYGSVMPTIAISLSGVTNLTFLGSGNAGRSCRLLSSPDLTSWVPIATNQIGSNGTILFRDAYHPTVACRFYRLVMP